VRRYLEVAKKSAAFRPGAIAGLVGRSGLAVMWLEHLLLLSMLQHPSGSWTWGRYVVVHPAGNSDIADACILYRGLLADDSTFSSTTLEDILASGALRPSTATALGERYLPTQRSAVAEA
jgi:PD-(D/E)XK nuclease superfamily